MTNIQLLTSAASHWAAMNEFRSRRERAKRYCYGKQWDDLVEVDGRFISEEEYIRSQGNVPLKNNLIRRLVRSVLGVFRNRYHFPTPEELRLDPESPTDAALYRRVRLNADINRSEELFARTMEEFLISGLAVHRKSTAPLSLPHSASGDSPLLRSDYVAPDSFFVDSAARDFRGWDTRIIGQTHDMDFPALCSALARSEEDMKRLREIYGIGISASGIPDFRQVCPPAMEDFGSAAPGAVRDFLLPRTPGACRVIEIWTRTSIARYRVHDRRTGRIFRIEESRRPAYSDNPDLSFTWVLDDVWHYHYLSPRGDVLATGLSPLPGGGHPYIWKGYPFIDGEIHSFVSDVIDQQRHTNRLITLYDWVLRSTAKGVLLFPESALPEGVELDDISDQWSRFNGVILFRPKAGMPLPQQVTGNASNVGITDLLNIQLRMFEDVSGVSSALEGKLASGAVSGKLYDQQTRQAMIALLDILETFQNFIRESTLLDLRLLSPRS